MINVPGYPAGQGVTEKTLLLDPGIYRWQAFSNEDGGCMATDPEGDTILLCKVREEDVYIVRIISLNPMISTFRYVLETTLFTKR